MAENYINNVSVDGVTYNLHDSDAEANAAQRDGYYEGIDLTVRFADEIAASPYSGDAWAWIRARILTGDFRGVHIGDWIPFTVTVPVGSPAVNTEYTYNAQVAGINTYKWYGDTAVVNHIDFICKELWHERHAMNKVNYNNGIAATGGQDAVQEPWLCSDLYHWLNSKSGYVPNGTSAGGSPTSVNYTAGGVYYYLPSALKSVITPKRIYAPRRYNASSLLTDDNSAGWVSLGDLWLPSEKEVFGAPIMSNAGLGSSGTPVQYPIFIGSNRFLRSRQGGGREHWWLLSAAANSSTYWCYVANNGPASSYNASFSTASAPICFRIA